ncbi:hypothetical protein WR25_01758 [Diploscapter pachys]|uniref:glucuronosyltransferase n=1 Tax=Diploscapter pachys TaxID=2018661 RepID=A0A2A2JI40_9BILA|nr:hypothetical protein WR25_01758 [Diploscapter pachys]
MLAALLAAIFHYSILIESKEAFNFPPQPQGGSEDDDSMDLYPSDSEHLIPPLTYRSIRPEFGVVQPEFVPNPSQQAFTFSPPIMMQTPPPEIMRPLIRVPPTIAPYSEEEEETDYGTATTQKVNNTYEINYCNKCSIGQTFVLKCSSEDQAFDSATTNCNFKNAVKECPEYDHIMHCSIKDTCTENEFACCAEPQACIHVSKRCDNHPDCADGEDEVNCPSCAKHEFACVKSGHCIDAEKRCDGVADDCRDGSNLDEIGCSRNTTCVGKFMCDVSRSGPSCIDWSYHCDGQKHCQMGEDETNCKTSDVKYLLCENQKQSVTKDQWCNGKADCADGSDEKLMESHVNFMAKLADVLVEAGHNVTILDSEIRPELFHRTKVAKDFITVHRSPEIAKITIDYKDMATTAWNSAISPHDQTRAMEKIGELSRLQCEFLANGDVIEKLKNLQPFDVGIHEVFDVCGLGVFESIDLKKHIIVSSTVMMDAPARYAGIYSGWSTSGILSDYGSEIAASEKMRNAEFHIGWERFFRMQTDSVEKTFAKRHSMEIPFTNLIGKTSAMFVNTHPLLESYKPWARFLYDIGGISVNPPQSLNENFNNVAFRKFLPQNDLINSGKTALFIGHGGQNGLLEASKAGVPIVVIPIFGDQHRNAKSFEEAGMAVLVKKTEFKSDAKIKAAIEESLNGQNTEVVLQFFYEIYQKLLIDSKVEKDEDQQKKLRPMYYSRLFVTFCLAACVVLQYHLLVCVFAAAPLAYTAVYIIFKHSQVQLSNAKQDGCTVVEFDILMSKDGVPILMHDDTTGRTAGLDLVISETDWEILKNLQLKDSNESSTIPTLESVVKWCSANSMKMIFDVKSTNLMLLQKLVDLIVSNNLLSSVIVSSFDPLVPYFMKMKDSRILTGYTSRHYKMSMLDTENTKPVECNFFSKRVRETMEEISNFACHSLLMPRFLGADMLLLNHREVSIDLRDLCHRYGIRLVAWAVNDPVKMAYLESIDVPYLTDVPHLRPNQNSNSHRTRNKA